MGLSYAVRKREQRGEPIEGQWLRAKKYVDAYQDYVFNFQNEDGGFSTRWFRARSNEGDIDRHLETTGHLVEWLVLVAPARAAVRPPRREIRGLFGSPAVRKPDT